MNAEKQKRLYTYKRELQSINEYLAADNKNASTFYKKFIKAARERKRILELNIFFIENPSGYKNHKTALENAVFHN
jgi:hypothetical protein